MAAAESMFKKYVKVDDKRGMTITFQLAPSHVAYANTLRRLCMTAVETVGFRADINDKGATSDVKVLANTTPMTNEMLAHRFGLIPVFSTKPTQWDKEKYTFKLSVTNESNLHRDVTTDDIMVFEDTTQIPSSQFFSKDTITNQPLLIAVLKPQVPGGNPEEIRIEANASVGVGRENARFIPTCVCAYSYTRDTDEKHVEQVLKDWLWNSKRLSLETLKSDTEKMGALMREFNTLEVNRCYVKDPATGEANSFDFTVESIGVLPPQYIVARACQKGEELCRSFLDLKEDVVVQPADSRLTGFDFIFQHQDHTLGHLIQAWLDQNLIGQGVVTFAGYDVPHPLRDEMVIRIGVADGKEETAREALRQAMGACATMFSTWYSMWNAVAGTGPAVSEGAVAAATPAVGSAPSKPRVVRRAASAKP